MASDVTLAPAAIVTWRCPGAPHRQPFAVAGTAALRHLDALFPAEVLARQTVGVGHHLLRRAGGHHLSPQRARAGADVDEPVGGAG